MQTALLKPVGDIFTVLNASEKLASEECMGSIPQISDRLEKPGRRVPGIRFDNNGGGGEYDGMEARIAKLEATQEFIQRDIKDLKEDVRAVRMEITAIRTTDFRLIFGALAGVALGLAGMMAKGFHWL
jgi:hypothetical protein